MYTNEQYKKITGKDYVGGFFEDSHLEGSDSSGVRFDLTSELVSKLSDKGYEVGLSEFRADYANALKIGSSVSEIQETLKTMNGSFITSIAGTNIVSALSRGISEFDRSSDSKSIVLLTDGEDNSLSSSAKRVIDSALSSNVKICAIGFGDGIKNTNLANISNATGCKFYSSSDARGLAELFTNMASELVDDLVDVDGDGTSDGVLLADSGFIVNRDGFSFANYGSNLSRGGHCYGMATFAQLYYKKKLPLTFDDKTVGDKKSYGYDLTDTYFKDYPSLYDYKLQTNALKYAFGFDLFQEETPPDFRILEDDALLYHSKYKEEIDNSGLYDYDEDVKSKMSEERQKQKYGFTFSTYTNLLLNEDKMQTNERFHRVDREMFNAIYSGHLKQLQTVSYSSGSDFILWLRNVFGTEDTAYSGGAAFIHILKARLEDKDAPVIFSDFSGDLHAVNAISLVQDIENPNDYYIGIYDNNYPGEKRYIYVECGDKTCVTVANEYYPKSNQPLRISPSLGEDLAYYQ